MKLSKKSFFGASIGTMVEYYDYALFAIFIPIIAPLFFRGETAYQSLSKGYLILMITSLAQPLGGLLFGYIGDFFGRRKALLASMYGIAIATFIMGITPSYQTIGIWSLIIILITKAIQKFCFGGEFNGAGIYVVEHARNQNEIYTSSILSATTFTGSLVASIIGILLTASFMPDWSWRLAFVLGGVIGAIGIFYRKNLLESPQFKEANSNQHNLRQLLRKFPKELLAGFFIGGLCTVPFTTVITFINPVLMTEKYFTGQQFMLVETYLIIVSIITLVVIALTAENKKPENIMRFGATGLILFSYVLLLLIYKGSLFVILIAQSLMIVMNEIMIAPSHAYFKKIFDLEFRYRAASFSFCLGLAVFGGLTPVIESKLYKMTGHFSSAAIWVMFVSIGTYLFIWLNQRKVSMLVEPLSISSCHYCERSTEGAYRENIK
ncbi:MAG: MFS transporter [Gammaproteobacteria bacterium]